MLHWQSCLSDGGLKGSLARHNCNTNTCVMVKVMQRTSQIMYRKDTWQLRYNQQSAACLLSQHNRWPKNIVAIAYSLERTCVWLGQDRVRRWVKAVLGHSLFMHYAMKCPATSYPPANHASHSQMTRWGMISIMGVAMAAHAVSPYKCKVKRVFSCGLICKSSHCMQ